MAETATPSLSFVETVKTFPRSFWMGNIMEMWERLAYYGVRVVAPIYIAQADEPGGLHFTQSDKATIYIAWNLVQSLTPMVSGGYADRYGYKNSIFLTTCMKIVGYLLMATQRSFGGFMFGVLALALGTALFKPAVQGTLAQSVSPRNASLGWGLFYWLVNVGGALGPPLAGYLHGKGWPWVFYGCAAIISLNFLMLFTYKEVESGADKTAPPLQVLSMTVKNLWDHRLWAVIAALAGFWLMMYQLWDFMPNFYVDWIDSSAFAASNTWLPESWLSLNDARGAQVKQENVLNLNAVLIVLFLVPFSYLAGKIKVLWGMALGFLIAILGILVSGTTQTIYVLFAGIALFSLGEMLTGPKKLEYFGLIAPPGKKALYLGYVNIPVGLGNSLGAWIAGKIYGEHGEKATLALKYLAQHTNYAVQEPWSGKIEDLSGAVGVERTKAFQTLCSHLGKNATETTELLWNTYAPYEIWYIFAAIGVLSLIGLLAIARRSKHWKGMDV